MSNITDEELQRLAEEGAADATGNRDLEAYKKLFSILGDQPAYLPTGLPEAVVAKIELSRKKSARRDYLWLSVGIFVLVLTGIVAVAVSDFRVTLSGWQRQIMTLGICAGVVIALLNTIERRLLHR